MDRTAAQTMMIEDGLPERALATSETRREIWTTYKPTQPAAQTATQETTMVTIKTNSAARKVAPAKKAPTKTTVRAESARRADKAKKPGSVERAFANAAKTATKAAKKPPVAPKPAKTGKTTGTGERADGLRPGSKQAIMLDMVLHPDGATENAICAKLDWKKCRVTLTRVCEKVGAALDKRKNLKGENVYFATMPKAKA